MSFRIFVIALTLLVLGGIAVLVYQPGLVGLQSSSGSSSANFSTTTTATPAAMSVAPSSIPAPRSGPSDTGTFNFTQSVNDLGDRIYLSASATVTVTPQASGPDRVSVTTSGGTRPGSFTFTIVPHQGSRGTRRAVGEFETTGQSFRVCEVVDDPGSETGPHAQRFEPVNSGGQRYALPIPIPEDRFVALINAAIGGTRAGANSTSFSPSGEAARLANALIPICTGQ